MLQNGLTWPQALALALAGAYVRRELWTDKRLFITAGALVWVDGSPSRVVQAADFGREEFLARDWTNMGFDQGHCLDPVIPTPNPTPTTHLLVNETAIVKVQSGYPGGTKMNPPSWGQPLIVDGRSYISRIQSRWSGGPYTYYWVHPITGVIEPVTYSQWPAVPASGQGPTVMLQRAISNPFSAPCHVLITGSATDALLLNGAETPLPASFQLGGAGIMYGAGGSGSTATVAALVRNPTVQPVAALNIDIAFSL